MKNTYIKVFLLVAVTVIFCSCAARRSNVTGPETIRKFDAAAFDYIYVEALKQKLTGNGGEALKYLEQCIKLNPESDAAYYQMAQIVIASGDIVNGKRYAAKAYRLDDKNIWYIMMLTGIYYQQGNLDSAIVIYEKAADYYPQKQNLQLSLANLYNEKKEYGKALGIHKMLEERYGINETTTPGYIQSMVVAGEYEDALKKAEELIDSYPAGIQYYALLAEIYREKGDRIKAEEVYRKLLEENPGNPEIQISVCDFLINEKKFEDLFLMLNPVILNTNIGREDKISLFARLIEIKELNTEQIDKVLLSLMVFEANYQNDDIVPLLRPEFMSNIGRDKDAVERLEEIIGKRQEDYYAWEKLLLLYLKIGDFKKLMIRGEECASKFNMSFLAKLLYANGALENGKYDVALNELRKAQILAGDKNDFIVQVLTMRADTYYRMKDFTKAFETFGEALKIDENDLTILNNYAYYLAEQNMNLKLAEEMAGKVIEKEKDNPTFLDTYAWVIFKRGRSKDAARIMERIILELSDHNAEYYEHYGFILKSMRKCDKAIENWNEAIKLDSNKIELKEEIHNCRQK